MATSEQRPPVNNSQANFDTNFDWKTSTERPPMYNGHFFGVPRVAVEDRFDCTKIVYVIEDLNQALLSKSLLESTR